MGYPKPGQCYLYWVAAFVLAVAVTEGGDTIHLSSGITGNQTIVSRNGAFELGFFSPGGNNKWYVGIWYAKIPLKTYVWVANRENPVNDSYSAALKLMENGRLVIVVAGNVSVWQTGNVKPASKAVILDSGNLVLIGSGRNPSPLWGSFQHPTDTWLPGMKVGVMHKFTSWKSYTDPAPGDFSLQLKSPGYDEFVLMWRNSVQYWSSGVWDGDSFEFIPEMTVKYIYNFSFVNPKSPEGHFSYTTENNMISRLALDKLGQIKQYTWAFQTNNWDMFWKQPKEKCNVYGLCGANAVCDANNLDEENNPELCECVDGFRPRKPEEWDLQDWSGGCLRSTPLQCRTDKFYDGGNAGFGTRNWVIVPGIHNQHSCEQMCLKNCSCSGFAYRSASECGLMFGDLLNLRNTTSSANAAMASADDVAGSMDDDNRVEEGNVTKVYVRIAACDLPKFGGGFNVRRTNRAAVIGAICGAGVLVAAVILNFIVWKPWRSSKRSADSVSGALTLSMFTYKELQIATRNFCDKLGSGGFGSVYKGNLPGSIPIAVKRLERAEGGEKQFRMEVSTIGTIQHVNLVRLRGFCSEGDYRLLVYDYMPNGSLNAFFQQNVLDWKTRFRIALGTARGIAYLHEECRDCIIHCDIKPENILLDADFSAKVSDFGLSKFVGRDFSRVLTTMRGTRGYLAPEWISGLPITSKADVYSFGMTLLEIVGGRRNIETGNVESEKWFFPPWAAKQVSLGNVMELVDDRLGKDIDVEEARRAAMVAIWCIQDDEDSRPTMGTVVKMLEGIIDVSVPPIPRTLQALMAETAVARSNSEMASLISSSPGPSSIVVANHEDSTD